MNTHVDKTQENKSQSVTNAVSQKQSSGESTFQFVDNRPEAVMQRKLQEMADNYSAQQQQPIQKKENKTGLPDDLKDGIENLSGYSMGDVKVHYNSDKPGQLQAHAYAQGTDIHLSSGQERHLPHEAWHVVQQKQGRVKPTYQQKGEYINDDVNLEKEADTMGEQVQNAAPCNTMAQLKRNTHSHHIIQCVFEPATVTTNAHLRNNGQWDTKIGNRIDRNSVLVVDKNQQITQVRGLLRSDTVWSCAVNTSPSTWFWAMRNLNTYIRDSSTQTINYPIASDYTLTNRPNVRPEKRWDEQDGEYHFLENSSDTLGATLVHKNAVNLRLTAGHQYQDLSPKETLQLNLVLLKASLKTRLKTILTNAGQVAGLDANLLDTDHNRDKLMHPIRFEEGKDDTGDPFINWYNWLDGVFERITAGAAHAANSIDHWRRWLHPTREDEVSINDIELTGSDLHDEGLGAIFVTFTKPQGPVGHQYENDTNFTIIIKSEDKSLENALFGTESTSLAKKVNTMANLNPDEAISTFRMKTSQNYGSIIEKVAGVQADSFGHPQPCTPAMREALVFAFITGLSDLHRENVLWHNGKPYFIDADNALNKARLDFTTPDRAKYQSGFTLFNSDSTSDSIDKIKDSPETMNSKIMRALLEESESELEPVIDAVKTAFAGKTGRVVPVSTSSWAEILKVLYIKAPEGNIGDDNRGTTRWGIAYIKSGHVPTGTTNTPEPGLEGETGIASSGRSFNSDTEIGQIKGDYDQGKIPFYTYDYNTGYVKHNGQTIWHGKPLSETIGILFTKFPSQNDAWETD